MSIQDYCGVSERDLCNAILKYDNTELVVNIKGALGIVLVLENASILISDNIIYLVDNGINEYRFEIWKDTINLVDIDEDFIELKLIDDGMITYLRLSND